MILGHEKQGDRTLGVITKPDRLEKDSCSERLYMSLARNEEVFLKLGWHVLKNRSFSEGDTTFLQRNANETFFFKSSNWKTLPKESTGTDALRKRLSHLLFNHVKGELPKLRDDLEEALATARGDLANLGESRSSPGACKSFLLDRSSEFSNTCRAAVGGHYDGTCFLVGDKADFDLMQLPSLRRPRAAVQELNANFSSEMLRAGQRSKILPDINSGDGPADLDCDGEVLEDKVSLCVLSGDRDTQSEDQSMTHE